MLIITLNTFILNYVTFYIECVCIRWIFLLKQHPFFWLQHLSFFWKSIPHSFSETTGLGVLVLTQTWPGRGSLPCCPQQLVEGWERDPNQSSEVLGCAGELEGELSLCRCSCLTWRNFGENQSHVGSSPRHSCASLQGGAGGTPSWTYSLDPTSSHVWREL